MRKASHDSVDLCFARLSRFGQVKLVIFPEIVFGKFDIVWKTSRSAIFAAMKLSQ